MGPESRVLSSDFPDQESKMKKHEHEAVNPDPRLTYIFVVIATGWSVILATVSIYASPENPSIANAALYGFFWIAGLALIYNSYRSTINKILRKN